MRALHDAHRADASNAKGKGGSFTKRPNENAAPARVLVFFQSCPIITPRMMQLRASPVASTNPVGRLLMELRLIVRTVHGSLTLSTASYAVTHNHRAAHVVIVRQ